MESGVTLFLEDNFQIVLLHSRRLPTGLRKCFYGASLPEGRRVQTPVPYGMVKLLLNLQESMIELKPEKGKSIYNTRFILFACYQ